MNKEFLRTTDNFVVEVCKNNTYSVYWIALLTIACMFLALSILYNGHCYATFAYVFEYVHGTWSPPGLPRGDKFLFISPWGYGAICQNGLPNPASIISPEILRIWVPKSIPLSQDNKRSSRTPCNGKDGRTTVPRKIDLPSAKSRRSRADTRGREFLPKNCKKLSCSAFFLPKNWNFAAKFTKNTYFVVCQKWPNLTRTVHSPSPAGNPIQCRPPASDFYFDGFRQKLKTFSSVERLSRNTGYRSIVLD